MTAPTQQPVSASGRLEVRRMPLPDREPPYDDDARGPSLVHAPAAQRPGAWVGAAAAHTTMVQGTLALAFVLPSGVGATPAPADDLRLLPERSLAAHHVDDEEFGPQPTPRGDLPCPRQWAARFVQAVAEVLVGDRPAAQLVRWTTRDVYEDIATRSAADHVRAGTARPLVRSVHVTEPADGVAEVAALVRRGPRSRAVALRLEGLDGRWQCSALELG